MLNTFAESTNNSPDVAIISTKVFPTITSPIAGINLRCPINAEVKVIRPAPKTVTNG